MPLFHIILSALIQGVTEFLPISSSGHLLLFHALSGQTGAQLNLMLDIAVHVGTLFAVVLYFHKDILNLFKGLLEIATGRFQTPAAHLAMTVIIGSVPVILAGLILHTIDPYWLRQTWIVATTTLIFGGLLWFVDDFKQSDRKTEDLSYKDALMIGLAQILALIPGTSRSGITMTAARALGLSRIESARYSLLLAVIATSGAGLLQGSEAFATENAAMLDELALAAILSFFAAMAAIVLMMKWLENQSFKIFAIYRIILGLGLFAALGLGWIA